MCFETEEQLLNTAMSSRYLISLLENADWSTYFIEPRGLFGIPDLVVVHARKNKFGNTTFTKIAFEMKLSNWQRALMQAFRYRAFANKSYVMLDAKFTNRAMKHIGSFRNANIGLLTIDKEGIVVTYFDPEHNSPYSTNLVTALQELTAESIDTAWVDEGLELNHWNRSPDLQPDKNTYYQVSKLVNRYILRKREWKKLSTRQTREGSLFLHP